MYANYYQLDLQAGLNSLTAIATTTGGAACISHCRSLVSPQQEALRCCAFHVMGLFTIRCRLQPLRMVEACQFGHRLRASIVNVAGPPAPQNQPVKLSFLTEPEIIFCRGIRSSESPTMKPKKESPRAEGTEMKDLCTLGLPEKLQIAQVCLEMILGKSLPPHLFLQRLYPAFGCFATRCAGKKCLPSIRNERCSVHVFFVWKVWLTRRFAVLIPKVEAKHFLTDSSQTTPSP